MAKKSFSAQAAFSLEIALFVLETYYGSVKSRWLRGLIDSYSRGKTGYSRFEFWLENEKHNVVNISVFCYRVNSKSLWEPVKATIWKNQEVEASYYIGMNEDGSFFAARGIE